MSKPKKTSGLTLLGHPAKFPEEPSVAILETFPNRNAQRDYLITFECQEFTSMCPVTGQPDFATITLIYTPSEKCVEMKSLKLYYLAFRNKGIFYEGVANTILDDLVAALKPQRMTVIADFNARGGTVGVTFGLDHDQQRFDFDYSSGVMANKHSYAIGGYYRQGKGVRETNMKLEEGGQIQGVYNMAFGGGNYLRLNFKLLDDQGPTNLPVPVRVVNGAISEIPGFDPRYSSPYGSNWPADPVLRRDNTLGGVNVNSGLSVKATNLGFEGGFDLGGVRVENRMRYSDLSGRFVGFLPDHYAAPFVQAGRLRAVHPKSLKYDCVFSCVHRRTPAPPRVAQAFRAALLESHNVAA